MGLAAITDKQYVLWGTMAGSALGLVSHLLYGAWSDRIGRKPVFLLGAIFTIVFGIPMFLLINTGAVIMVVVAVALSLLLSHDPIFAVESSWFSELFSRDVRSSGISLGYNGASILAGLLPFLATALYARRRLDRPRAALRRPRRHLDRRRRRHPRDRTRPCRRHGRGRGPGAHPHPMRSPHDDHDRFPHRTRRRHPRG
ncbi:hypothetical protein HR12_09070, partial [Microbacterium sp. SUBG005]